MLHHFLPRFVGVVCSLIALPLCAQVTTTLTLDQTTVGVGQFIELTVELSNGGQVSREVDFQTVLPAGSTGYLLPEDSSIECAGVQNNGRETITTITGGLGNAQLGVNIDLMQPDSICTVTWWIRASVPGTQTIQPSLTVEGISQAVGPIDYVVETKGGVANFGGAQTLKVNQKKTLVLNIDVEPDTFIDNFTIQIPQALELMEPHGVDIDCDVLQFEASIDTDANQISVTKMLDFGTQTHAGQSDCSISFDVMALEIGTHTLKTNSIKFGDFMLTFQQRAESAGAALGFMTVENTPVSMVLTTTPSIASPGETVDLTYTMRGHIRSDTLSNGSLAHDLSTQLPGAIFTQVVGHSGCTDAEDAQLNDSLLTVTNVGFLAGEICEITVRVAIAPSTADNRYNLTANLSVESAAEGTVNTIPAQSTLTIQSAVSLEVTPSVFTLNPGSTLRLSVEATNTSAAPVTNVVTTFGGLYDLIVPDTLAIANLDNCAVTTNIIQVTSDQFEINSTVTEVIENTPCTFDLEAGLRTELISNDYAVNLVSTFERAGATLSQNGPTLAFNVPRLPRFRAVVNYGDAADPAHIVYELDARLNGADVEPATTQNIEFTQDIGAILPGLTANAPQLSDACDDGAVVSVNNGVLSVLLPTLLGGTLCTLTLPLQVPQDTQPGRYPVVTSPVSMTLSGDEVTLSPMRTAFVKAGLEVQSSVAPQFILAGTQATYTLTLTNPSQTDAISGISAFINGTNQFSVSSVLPETWCGANSAVTPAGSGMFLSNGALAAGESCTFAVVFEADDAIQAAQIRLASFSFSGSLDNTQFQENVSLPIVTVTEALIVDQSLTHTVVGLNDDTTLKTTLTNLSTLPVSDISWMVTLDDLLNGLAPIGELSLPIADICGAGSTLELTQTNELVLTNGQLAGDGVCTFEVPLRSPDTAPETPPTGQYTSDVSYVVNALTKSATAPTLFLEFKEFDIRSTFNEAAPGESSVWTLAFERFGTGLDNQQLSFAFDLQQLTAGLTPELNLVNEACGAARIEIEDSIFRVRGLALEPRTPCTLVLDVALETTTTPGTYEATTGALSDNGLVVAGGVPTTLVVVTRPLIASMTVNPQILPEQSDVTVSIELDNTPSAIAAQDVFVNFDLPVGLSFASDSQATDCAGNLTLVEDTGTAPRLRLDRLEPNAVCTVSIDAKAVAAGNLTIAPTTINASTGISSTDAASIEVGYIPPTLALSTQSPGVFSGQSIPLTLTINHGSSGLNLTSTALTATYSENMSVNVFEPVDSNCEGFNASSDTGLAEFSTGALVGGGQCQVSWSVTSETVDTYTVVGEGVSTPHGALDPTTVEVSFEAPPAYEIRVNTQDPITEGSEFSVSFALTNRSALLPVNAIEFDFSWAETLAVNLPFEPTSNCSLGLTSLDSEARSGALAIESMPAGGACTVTFSMRTVRPFSGQIDVTHAQASSGTLPPNRAVVEISQIPMTFELDVAPNLAFVGTPATLTARINNQLSNADAASLTGLITLSAGTFAQPLEWDTTCPDLTISADNAPSAALVSAPAIPAGQDCLLNVTLDGSTVGVLEAYGQLGSETTAETSVTGEFTREAGPEVGVEFSAQSSVQEGLNIDVDLSVTNRAETLTVQDTVVTFQWSETLSPVEGEDVTSNCDVAQVVLDPTTRTGTLTLSQIDANGTCTVSLPITAVAPGLGFVEITTVQSSAGTPVASARDEIEITQVELSYEMTAEPSLDFQDRIATVALRIDNRESISTATSFLGHITVENGIFVQPLNWTTTCDSIVVSNGDGDGDVRLIAAELPAGFACDLTIDVRGTLLGRTTVNGAFESQASSPTNVETDFEREPKPVLDVRFATEEIELGEPTDLFVVLSNPSNRLLVDGVSYGVTLNENQTPLGDFTTTCEGQFQQSNDEPVEVAGTGLNFGQRCTAQWQVTPTQAGVFEVTVGPVTTGAGTVESQTVQLSVVQAEMPMVDQGILADAGRSDAGVVEIDASAGSPIEADEGGCACDQTSQTPGKGLLWSLLCFGGLNIARRRRTKR